MSTKLARSDKTILDPTLRISQAIERLETQQQALEQLAEAVKDEKADIATHPARYAALCAAYDKQADQVERSQETVRRLQEAIAIGQSLDGTYWKQRTDELTNALMTEYSGRGPQYEILVRRLVFAEVLVEQLEGTARALHTAEWRAGNRAVLDATQALQKYTESQKSEMVQRERQQAMLVIMELAERVISPRHPDSWTQIVDEIDRLMLNPGHDDDGES